MRLALALLFVFTLTPDSSPAHAAAFDARTVVFIGSSSIDFWKTLPQDFAGKKVLNLGKAGTTYSYLTAHAEEWAVKYPSERYVIYSGDNDMAWLGSPAKVAEQLRLVAETLRRKIPRVEIFVLSIKPNRALLRRLKINKVRKANELLEAEAERLGYVTYVDVHSKMLDDKGRPRAELFGFDGIHMNAKGYRIWRDTLLPLLEN